MVQEIRRNIMITPTLQTQVYMEYMYLISWLVELFEGVSLNILRENTIQLLTFKMLMKVLTYNIIQDEIFLIE